MQPICLDPAGRCSAEPFGIAHKRSEHFAQHLARALIHLRDARMIIDIRIKKFSQLLVRCPELIAVTNLTWRNRCGGPPYNFCARPNHVAHLPIDNLTDDEFVQLRFAHLRKPRPDCRGRVAPDRDLVQLREAENLEIYRVIQVVTIVGDLIGHVCHLRFQGTPLALL